MRKKEKELEAEVTSRNLPLNVFVQPSYLEMVQAIEKELK